MRRLILLAAVTVVWMQFPAGRDHHAQRCAELGRLTARISNIRSRSRTPVPATPASEPSGLRGFRARTSSPLRRSRWTCRPAGAKWSRTSRTSPPTASPSSGPPARRHLPRTSCRGLRWNSRSGARTPPRICRPTPSSIPALRWARRSSTPAPPSATRATRSWSEPCPSPRARPCGSWRPRWRSWAPGFSGLHGPARPLAVLRYGRAPESRDRGGAEWRELHTSSLHRPSIIRSCRSALSIRRTGSAPRKAAAVPDKTEKRYYVNIQYFLLYKFN